MCFVRDMNYISVLSNAFVVALMAIYIYQNEKRMEEIAAKHNQTVLNIAQFRETKEIAYGKKIRHSSDYDHRNASASVDGNLDTINHTRLDEFPFLEVDVGNIFLIKRIDIFNRKDCCGERLHNLDIAIGSSLNQMYLCAHYKGPGFNGKHLVFECNQNKKICTLREVNDQGERNTSMLLK